MLKNPVFLAALAGMAALSAPVAAEAAQAFATANVNLRAGPSTQYPPVLVVPTGNRVEIFGCLSSANWCDVGYSGYRGWISGSYLQTTYSQRRIYVDPDYYRPLGIPTVTFSVGSYWDRYYRGRDFYRERDRWRRAPPPPPAWHRGDNPPPPDMRGDDNRSPRNWRDDNRRPRADEGDRPDRRPPPPRMSDGDRRPDPDMQRPPQTERPDRRPPQQSDRPDRRQLPPAATQGQPQPNGTRPPWIRPQPEDQQQ
ncbi:SH3 domain-containing protein [Allorhizobium undicola]|uniref:SH3 domain-containing protein n=1 Tax=Allorhizobium undicola TaxID=78527 RepID=UPI003D3592FC